MQAIGYVRCSTQEQQQSGLGLSAQRSTIEAACAARGWELVRIAEDIASGARKDRPGLERALQAIDRGEADVVVALRVDRLSRSVSHFASLLERYPRAIVSLDLGLEPGSVAAEFVSTVVAAASQMERKITGQRTREALQAARASGTVLGRPREISEEAMDRIRELHRSGHRIAEIARILNVEGVPTPRKGRWHSPGVKRVLSWARQG